MDPNNNQAGQAPAQPQGQSLQQLRQGPQLPAVEPGFASLNSFELLQRQAKALANSTLVPTAYQAVIRKYDKEGNIKSETPNEQAIPNTMIALNMAVRMGADPVMVMQNLYIVEGRPSWSSQWVIAQINNCGRFEPLRFDMIEKGRQEVSYEYTEWKDGANGRRVPERKTKTMEVENVECIAWTVPKGVKVPHGVITLDDAKKNGLPVLKGPKVSVDIAVKEGWYTKTGSKWQTIPELMLMYRSGAFFGRLYAPELLMGFPTNDEVEDQRQPVNLAANEDGTYAPAEQPTAPAATTVADLQQQGGAAPRRRATDKAEAVDAHVKAAGEAGADTPTAGAGQARQQQDNPTAAAGAEATQNQQQPAKAADQLFGNTD